MKLKFIIILLLFVKLTLAQELYVCESYSEDGKPVGVSNNIKIKPYGSAFYILLDNEKPLKDKSLFLFIDKFYDGKFKPFESKKLEVEKEDTWAVTSFEFKDPGVYEIYFLNSSQKRLTTQKLEVDFEEEYKSMRTKKTNNLGNVSFTGTNKSFIFCELVINNKPKNPLSILSLTQSEGKVFVYLNNNSPFGIEKIKVKFWKIDDNDENKEKLIDTKKYKIMPEWSDLFFSYDFDNIGTYRIEIYDYNNNFISANTLEVSN
ncbi:MAG: hypothetical protein CR986_07785 [Ignavibacteriae bacterium]|nr:MAG: hypothetical protein CR986_07785 [Ignavibacteriota bacterium]